MNSFKNNLPLIVAVVVALMVVLSMQSRPEKNVVGQSGPALKKPVRTPSPKSIPAFGGQAAVPPAGERSGLNFADLIARLQACQAENNPDVRAGLEEQLEAELTDANAAGILRALTKDLLATPFAEDALRRWVGINRAAAAGWAAQQTGLTEPEQTSVIYGWGAQDKKALDDYLDHLPADGWKQSAMKFAANDALAAGNPKDAIDLLVKMDRTSSRDDLLNWSATAWAQADSTAALQWANNLQDASRQQKALGAVAVGLAWSDPQAAGRLLAQSVKPGEVLDQSALSVVCVWSQSDPQAAANWVTAFPEGALQQKVLETLIQRWTTQDAAAAKNWVAALPDGPLHETAVQFLAAAQANLQKWETPEASLSR